MAKTQGVSVARKIGAQWSAGPVLAGLAGYSAAIGGLLLSAYAGHPYGWLWWLVQVVGLSFVTAGVIAWCRQPANGTGRLMTAVGTTWYLGDLQLAGHRTVLFAVGFCLFYVVAAVFTHLILALPTGRLIGRTERLVVAGLYAAVSVPQVLRYVWEYEHLQPQIWGASYSFWAPVGSLSAGALTIAAFYLVVRRWRKAGKPSRRALAALWGAGAVAGLIALVWTVMTVAGSSADTQGVMLVALAVALIFTPFAILAGLLRIHLARLGVATLVQELEKSMQPRQLQDALSEALGDRSLRICFRRASGDYVDVDGCVVAVPPPGNRAMTSVEHEGEELAVLVHDPVLSQQTSLTMAVVAVARLHLSLQAQLDEVRASRARIVLAADRERHSIQGRLHDGAQQGLLAVALHIGQVRDELANGGDVNSAVTQLGKTTDWLHDVFRGLRDLIEGIDPPALTEQGLAGAVEVLALTAPLPIRWDIPRQRWPEQVERTAYFVIQECLANIYKHASAERASVCVNATGTTLVVQVSDNGKGGADPSRGSGLAGLRDRVAVVNGTLSIQSRPGATCIKAELPCA